MSEKISTFAKVNEAFDNDFEIAFNKDSNDVKDFIDFKNDLNKEIGDKYRTDVINKINHSEIATENEETYNRQRKDSNDWRTMNGGCKKDKDFVDDLKSALNRRCFNTVSCRSYNAVVNKKMLSQKRRNSDETIRFGKLAFRADHGALRSQENGSLSKEAPERSRSQYSLVSCSELTPGSLAVWVELPEEIKYDPSLAAFRQLYEKEYGKVEVKPVQQNGGPTERLPGTKSEPQLQKRLSAGLEHEHGKGERQDIGNNNVEMVDPGCDHEHQHAAHGGDMKTETKMERARRYVKIAMLLGVWMFFTVVFMLHNEKETVILHSFVAPTPDVKTYFLKSPLDAMDVLVQLKGPFWSEQSQIKWNSSEHVPTMKVWLERQTLQDQESNSTVPESVLDRQVSEPLNLFLRSDQLLDFAEGELRTSRLSLKARNTTLFSSNSIVYALRMKTDINQTIPFTMTYTENPLSESTGVIYSCILLCGLYTLIIFEVINRTMAAVVTSTAALAVLAIIGERPSMPELISWLDTETLLLLFSMMVLVAIMAETGIFDFLAVFTFEVTKGKMWPLINLLCAITAVLSTFLDNVTTVLLMTPVTIRLCEVMELKPVPILMAMVIYSNIGGTATPVGDPPNVIIASNAAVVQSGINFTNFTLHMTLGIVLVCVQTYFQLRFMYRDTSKMRHSEPQDILQLRQQLAVWRRAAASLAGYSEDEQLVRSALERSARRLSAKLDAKMKERRKRACPKDTFQQTLKELKTKYKIRDKVLLIKAAVAIAFVVAVFFLHAIPELKRVSLGWTALLGAILLLILADREDLEPILSRVEWSTLLFFAALFILMEALSKLGLIAWIGGLTEAVIQQVDESARLAVAILLMLWVSGITSAFVDNIPLTTMMVRVVTSLAANPKLDLPMAPLIWALSFGACLGGNGTLIGASANVVCAGVAEQHGYRITFVEFFKVGFPIMIGHLVAASIYLMICHCAFQWH